MDKLKEVMQSVLECEIDENTSMENCAKWDSANHVFLVLEIQEEFGVKISFDKIDKITSFSAIKDFLNL